MKRVYKKITTCSKCGRSKPPSFGSWCNICDRAAVKESRRDRKSRAVKEMGGACQVCGGAFPDCCFDFHHKDSSLKELSPSLALNTRPFEEAMVEVRKCILVCANCHRNIHWSIDNES